MTFNFVFMQIIYLHKKSSAKFAELFYKLYFNYLEPPPIVAPIFKARKLESFTKLYSAAIRK